MSDIIDEINKAHRTVGTRAVPAGETRTIPLRRTYDAPLEDVRDACTDPERIGRGSSRSAATCGPAADSGSRAARAGRPCAANRRGRSG